MRNEYQYIDPDSIYTDPETGILRNLGGITDPDALNFVETAATTKRTNELKSLQFHIADSNALFAIHCHLFQDVYNWAGKQRTVEISKGGKQFFPLSRFDIRTPQKNSKAAICSSQNTSVHSQEYTFRKNMSK